MGAGKQTVGYMYYMPLHFVSGIGRGPTAEGIAVRDCLFEIQIGEKPAWNGAIYENGSIVVEAPDLFGGDEKEGGVSGTLDVMFGAPDQAVNAYLEAEQGDPQSAHRGLFSLVWRNGQVCSNNPYLKPWAFARRRITGGWFGECWYPEKAAIPLEASTGAGGGEGVPVEMGFNIGRQVELDPSIDVVARDQCTVELAESHGFDYELLDGAFWFWRANESGLGFIKTNNEGNITAVHALIAKGWQIGETALIKSIAGPIVAVILTTVDVAPSAPAGYAWYPDGNGAFSTALGTVYMWFAPIYQGDNAESIGGGDAGRYCMNPAHIVYQCLTDPNCLGYPTAAIDATNFAAVADQLYAEGLGLNLKWTNQETIENFIGVVCDHAGMILIKDRRTGLMKLRLLRDDYDIEDLKVFTPSNCRIVGMQRPSPADIVNELQVTYTDYKTFKEATVPVRDPAAVQAMGRIVSKPHSLTGLPTEALTIRCGLRDLAAMSTPLWRFDLEFLRDADTLEPGEPFVLDWPVSERFPDGLFLVLRVADEIDYGTAADGTIKAKCVQDVFSLPDTGYIGALDPVTEPDRTPLNAVATMLEVPYRELAQNMTATELDALADDAGYVAALAVRPNTRHSGFDFHTRLDPADFALAATGDFVPSTLLSAAVLPMDTVLPIAAGTDLDQLEVGTAAFLGEGADAEMVRIDAIAEDGSTVTVGRGCGDTVPHSWPAGTRLWCYDSYGATDETQYIDGEEVEGKVLPRTSSGVLDIANAGLLSVEMKQRQFRSYPPGSLMLNDAPFYGEGTSVIPGTPGGGGGGGGGGGPTTPPAVTSSGAPASTTVGPNGGFPDDAPYPVPEPTVFGTDVVEGGDFSDPGDISNWRDANGNPLDSRWSLVDGRLCFYGTGQAAAFLWSARRTLAQQLIPHYSFTIDGTIESDAGAKGAVGVGIGFSTYGNGSLAARSDPDIYGEQAVATPAEYGEPTAVSHAYADKRADYGSTVIGQVVLSIYAPAVLAVVDGPAARVYFDDVAMLVAENAVTKTPQTIPNLDFSSGLTDWVQFPPAAAGSPSPVVSGGEVTFTPVTEYGVHKYLININPITDLDEIDKWLELIAEVNCNDPTVFSGTTRGGVGLSYAVSLDGGTTYEYTGWANVVERGDWTERKRWIRRTFNAVGLTFHVCILFKCALGYYAAVRNLSANVAGPIS